MGFHVMHTCHLEVKPLEVGPLVLLAEWVWLDKELNVAGAASIHYFNVASIMSRADMQP
jgi:hypothetical protein